MLLLQAIAMWLPSSGGVPIAAPRPAWQTAPSVHTRRLCIPPAACQHPCGSWQHPPARTLAEGTSAAAAAIPGGHHACAARPSTFLLSRLQARLASPDLMCLSVHPSNPAAIFSTDRRHLVRLGRCTGQAHMNAVAPTMTLMRTSYSWCNLWRELLRPSSFAGLFWPESAAAAACARSTAEASRAANGTA